MNLNDSIIAEETNSRNSLIETPTNELLNEALFLKDEEDKDDDDDDAANETMLTSSSRRSSTCSFISFESMTQIEAIIQQIQNESFEKRKSLSDNDLMDNFTLNIHRIDKDVTRCDRHYFYFTSQANLKKLRDIMYTYVEL